MAAIIAQLTRAKREREKREKIMQVSVDECESKCHYSLPEFEKRFDPKLHNSYCIRFTLPFLLNFIVTDFLLDKRNKESEKKKKRSLGIFQKNQRKLRNILRQNLLGQDVFQSHAFQVRFEMIQKYLLTFNFSLHGCSGSSYLPFCGNFMANKVIKHIMKPHCNTFYTWLYITDYRILNTYKMQEIKWSILRLAFIFVLMDDRFLVNSIVNSPQQRKT